MKESLSYLIDLVLHLDKHLSTLSNSLGGWMYVILFAVVFCETGLIVTPFRSAGELLSRLSGLSRDRDFHGLLDGCVDVDATGNDRHDEGEVHLECP